MLYDFCCLRSSFGSISSWINDIQSKKRTKLLIYWPKWKISLSGLTFGCKRSCDSATGGPIFAKLVSKYPQDFKEKSHEAARLKACRFCVRCIIRLGGGGGLRGPLEAPPSAVRVKYFSWVDHVYQRRISYFTADVFVGEIDHRSELQYKVSQEHLVTVLYWVELSLSLLTTI